MGRWSQCVITGSDIQLNDVIIIYYGTSDKRQLHSNGPKEIGKKSLVLQSGKQLMN